MEDSKRKAELLIDRYLQGETDSAEDGKLERAYLNAAGKKELPGVDEKDMEEISRMGRASLVQLITEIRGEGRRTVPMWPRIVIAAAVATFIVSAGIWFFASRHPDAGQDPGYARYANDVAPGKQGATLTLANGKKIRLTDAANGELAKEAGVIVTKTADGKLVYEILKQVQDDDRTNNQTAQNNDRTNNQPGHSNTTRHPEFSSGSQPGNNLNILSTAKGETYDVRLPDGTLVSLNAASSLTYSANLFERGKRRVKLDGEGYFEVAKDKAHPFIVETNTQEVEVLGTHFNVNAYTDEFAVRTTLLEGSVKIAGSKDQRILKPGEQGINNGKSLSITKVDVDQVVDWKEGEFNLDELNFRETMRKLARWYDIEVVYDQSIPADIKSGGWISRNSKLSAVLKLIENSGQVKFKIEGKKVYVYK